MEDRPRIKSDESHRWTARGNEIQHPLLEMQL
jgi:hypothetical protein